jgi:hypothetical protein
MRTTTTTRHLRRAALVLLACALWAQAATSRPAYRLDLAVDWDGATFAGSVEIVFENEADVPIDRIGLNLFANDATIYGEARLVLLGVAVGGIDVTLPVQTDPTYASLPLPRPVSPGQTESLVARFLGIAAPSPETSSLREASGYGILTKNTETFVLTAFYPMLAPAGRATVDAGCGIGDRLWSESSDYAVTVHTTAAVGAAATGELLFVESHGDVTVHRFQAVAARDFSIVLTREYEEAKAESAGVVLRSHFPAQSREASARALELACDAVSIYGSRVGPLPTSEVDIAEVPLQRVAGVEFDGLILVSASYARQPRDPFYDIIISHEMAHQWFYAAVGNDPAAEPWLDEALATYLSNVFLDEVRGEATAATERQRWDTSYTNCRRTDPSLAIGLPACAFPTSSLYAALVYDGGAWFLHAIRSEVGDVTFFSALSAYFAEHVGRVATTRDLLSAFEIACGCDLGALYESFGFSTH